MPEINVGDVVRVSTSPGFKDVAGVLTDPTTVSLLWRPAGGATVTWVHPTNAQIVKDGVGLYHADIPVTLPGLHYFRWVGTGAIAAAEGGTFRVVPFPGADARPTMAALIAHLRLLVGDPAGDTQAFADSELQGFLDERRSDVALALLVADDVYSGAPVVYRSRVRWWESDAAVAGGAVADDGADPLNGAWELSTAPSGSVYVTGRRYDMHGSAYAVQVAWAARLAGEFDFATDGQSFSRSQKSAAHLAVGRENARRAIPPAMR